MNDEIMARIDAAAEKYAETQRHPEDAGEAEAAFHEAMLHGYTVVFGEAGLREYAKALAKK